MTSEDIKELICEDDEKLKQLEEIRKKHLAEHPYITEEMECFISTKWGAYDYPGGKIISWISQNNDVYIICASVSKYVRWCAHKSINDTIQWLKLEEESVNSDTKYTI